MQKTEDQFDIIQRVKWVTQILLIAIAYALFLIFQKSSAEVAINFWINGRKALISVCHQGKEKEQHSHKMNYGWEKLTFLFFFLYEQAKKCCDKTVKKTGGKVKPESRNSLPIMTFH